jgi:hypothetical protein
VQRTSKFIEQELILLNQMLSGEQKVQD